MRGALATLAAMALSSVAWGQTAPAHHRTEQVTVTLVPAVAHVRPGDRLLVGLQQQIAPGWHTYWSNPGDSGLATRLDWTLPAGASAGPIQWPTPTVFKAGSVVNYGYADQTTLLTEIQVPAQAPVGRSLPIQVAASWLVCHEVCIPQKATLGLSLPVVAPYTVLPEPDRRITQAQQALPRPLAWPVRAEHRAQGVALQLPAQGALAETASRLYFFPAAPGAVAHEAPQELTRETDHVTLSLKAGEAPLSISQPLEGVLVVTQGEGAQARRAGYVIRTPLVPAGGGSREGPGDAGGVGLASALMLALLGGLVLNLMPCVFPVLSIKALALLQHSEASPARARRHGLAYTAGVLLSFTALGVLLILVQAAGHQAGWGFQFHSPFFVLTVAYLMFAVGLSLSGVFSIGQSISGVGDAWAQRSGYAGSFFTGVLATIVATPCTAPFMGGAIGFALTQPAPALLAVFLSLGLGLSLPYLILSVWPRLQRGLPRPGLWMERLKQALAFPMYAASAWLVWVLAQQAGVDAVAVALGGLIALAVAAWVYDSSRRAAPWGQRLGAGLAFAAVVAALAGGQTGLGLVEASAAPVSRATAPLVQAFSQSRLDALRAEGKPVFLNLTAAWCITCLVNERVALSQPEVQRAFQAHGLTYLKGDWTRQDPEITAVLQRFGRSGVPLYVYYPPGANSRPVVLPQILTPGLVVASLQAAPRLARIP